MKKYQPTIGIEIHVELGTLSKMFCGCPAEHFRTVPNTLTCPVCLGLPGALPVPNEKAIQDTIKIGLALHCKVSAKSKFDRKQYFYPDLPKGYQITQYDEPLCTNGHLFTSQGKVRITRVHLEEDTGKLLHKKVNGKDVTLVDFNRSGVPLVEIVTEPDIHSAAQAKEFAQKLRHIIRYLEVSDCGMEKGSMRLEVNVSWGLGLGYKVEVKNLNSFRFVKRAIDYELKRQKKLLESGKTPKQETRGWDDRDNRTKHQRYKETSADYRYFPEPDIPPLTFSKRYISGIKKTLPELPDSVAQRLEKTFKLRPQYAKVLSAEKATAEFAEQALKISIKDKVKVRDVASLIINRKVNITKTTPAKLVESVKRKKGSRVRNSKTVEPWVDQAISQLPKAAQDYRKGKKAAIEALIGKVMQLSKGQADPTLTKKLLQEKLK